RHTRFSRDWSSDVCSSDLSTGVEAMGIGPGDEVITSPYSDFGTIASILMRRALPVMADLDKYSFQMDPDNVEKRITRNTKAIIRSEERRVGKGVDLGGVSV